jgi:asparagine synthase (glutamine-hydrolysing)
VPGTLKVKKFIGKYLLKELGRKILPPELKIDRKRGFTVPLSEWFRGPLLPRIKGILFERRGSLFNPAYIQTLLHEHNSGVDHGTRLFSLLVFYLWEKENFEVSV